MSLIKLYAMVAICAALLWCSSDPADDDYIDPNANTLIINGEKPFALLEKGVLAPVMNKQSFTIPGITDAGEKVEIPATRDVCLGYILNIGSTPNPRQTVALDFGKTYSGVWELKVENADFSDSFYPQDPREILIKMYATRSNKVALDSGEFRCAFSLSNNLVTADGIENMNSHSGIYGYEGKVAIGAKGFEIQHGTLLASPLPVEFVPVGNPFIRSLVMNGRPFYREIDGIPACFNAILLEMIGDSQKLSVKASFVGALNKSALSVFLDPSIIPSEDLQRFLAVQQAKVSEQ